MKLTFDKLSTVLAQIEACLNSCPLVPLNKPDEDGIEALTHGHFLIGRPVCALPDPSSSYCQLLLLKHWELCQSLSWHFWKRWFMECLTMLNKFCKCQNPTRNWNVGGVLILNKWNLFSTKLPLAGAPCRSSRWLLWKGRPCLGRCHDIGQRVLQTPSY